MTGLGEEIYAVLEIPSDSERLAWACVLSALSVHAADSDAGRDKLIDLALTDKNANVRAEAYKGLHAVIQDSKPQHGSNSALVNGFKSVLNDSRWFSRQQAIELLQFDVSSMSPLLIFHSILQPLVAPLMQVALNDESEFVRDAAQNLLIFLITHTPAEGPLQFGTIDIRSTVLSTITDSIELFSDRDKLVALGLIEAIPENFTYGVVSPFAQGLIRLLKTSHVPTRATALEILTILYRKGLVSDMMHSNLSEIVTLALEDDCIGNQVIALKLLTSVSDDKTLRRIIEKAQPMSRLLSFLEDHELRFIVVELISVLAQDLSGKSNIFLNTHRIRESL
ncbi:armadillo-type protein [Coprinopsis sp. MPI-PUGE-AT-0042]|nr:armadillo-type protein [Coprinopsis sp. MPI-PUGE-AT-0042]